MESDRQELPIIKLAFDRNDLHQDASFVMTDGAQGVDRVVRIPLQFPELRVPVDEAFCLRGSVSFRQPGQLDIVVLEPPRCFGTSEIILLDAEQLGLE